MQSSARNCENVRLKTAIHSARESFVGSRGTRPVVARSVLVDEGEAAKASLFLALAAAPGDVAHRRADSAGEHEAGRHRAHRDHRQLRAQLPGDVGRLAELAAELLDRGRELLAFRLDLLADLLRSASVRRRHQRLSAFDVSLASRIACSGTGGVPLRMPPSASTPSTAASPPRIAVTISSASQVARKVANTAAIVANRKPSMKTAKTAAAAPMPMPMPSAATFFFSSRPASSSSSFAIALACSATVFAAAPTPPFCACSVSGVCMASPVDHLRGGDPRRERERGDEPRADPAAARLALPPRPAHLRSRRRDPAVRRALVRRRLALRARDYQRPPQLADELCFVGERGCKLRLHTAPLAP